MKRVIASQAPDNVRQAYAELENSAYHLGYSMSLDSNLNLTFTSNGKNMPELIVKRQNDRGDTYYDVSVRFPELHSGPDDYADSIEYFTKQFYEVGKFITEINKFTYNPSNYQD